MRSYCYRWEAEYQPDMDMIFEYVQKIVKENQTPYHYKIKFNDTVNRLLITPKKNLDEKQAKAEYFKAQDDASSRYLNDHDKQVSYYYSGYDLRKKAEFFVSENPNYDHAGMTDIMICNKYIRDYYRYDYIADYDEIIY